MVLRAGLAVILGGVLLIACDSGLTPAERCDARSENIDADGNRKEPEWSTCLRNEQWKDAGKPSPVPEDIQTVEPEEGGGPDTDTGTDCPPGSEVYPCGGS